eukprot:m.139841 g.139841  ORF g.139841 m.139841 type:complete len:92 (-) comp30085_c0_seq1:68-343(-)
MVNCQSLRDYETSYTAFKTEQYLIVTSGAWLLNKQAKSTTSISPPPSPSLTPTSPPPPSPVQTNANPTPPYMIISSQTPPLPEEKENRPLL